MTKITDIMLLEQPEQHALTLKKQGDMANGKLDVVKAMPIIFDPFNNDYLKVGEKVGNAFSDGKQLK